MLNVSSANRSMGTDDSQRRQAALERVHELITSSEQRAARAWRNYHLLQGLTIGLAAITPCLIVLAKESPNSWLLNWLQLFFPAVAAICAGLSHIFHWREDAVRYTSLAEAIRSQLWRFSARAGEFNLALSDDVALDRLVIAVDELNLKTVAQWSAAQMAETIAPAKAMSPPVVHG
ncbi:MAG TPA: DUF4231 domain-containing protein [Chloroflexota bacterium]|jgi:hypothetical protein|nr:DUF4231 domain-containing protein [Chloroflexota bacterium]